MPAVLVNKKARWIRQQSTTISEQLEERDELDHARTQSLVWGCVTLGSIWRSLVESLASDGTPTDYRALAPLLRQEAATSLENYEATWCAVQVEQASGQGFDGLADLQLVRHEAGNLIRWLDTWPSAGGAQREAAREDIREGRTVSVDDFIAEFQRAS